MNSLSHKVLIKLKKWFMPTRILYALGRTKAPIIIEVGANDGKTGDPLYKIIKQNPNGKAILIEPVPYLFERLKKTYSDCSHCIFENIGIASESGHMPIYYADSDARLSMPNLPDYFEELASFDRSRIANLLGTQGESFMCEELVETMSLKTLMERHKVTHVDLLQIDTEGYDFEVLKTFPFNVTKPKVVCFEHCHFTEEDRSASREMMLRNGYHVEKWGKDFLCVIP